MFVGRRRGLTEAAWQMPQGGIDKGEPQEAALRELGEEIGMANAEIVDETEDWLYYDLPADLVGKAFKGRYRGQRQWFAMRFLGADSDVDLEAHEVEFEHWKWALSRSRSHGDPSSVKCTGRLSDGSPPWPNQAELECANKPGWFPQKLAQGSALISTHGEVEIPRVSGLFKHTSR